MVVLDQETRRGQHYLVLERVLELKEFINESVKLHNRGLLLTAPQ